jgi:hypothetical protein
LGLVPKESPYIFEGRLLKLTLYFMRSFVKFVLRTHDGGLMLVSPLNLRNCLTNFDGKL